MKSGIEEVFWSVHDGITRSTVSTNNVTILDDTVTEIKPSTELLIVNAAVEGIIINILGMPPGRFQSL